MDDLEDVEVRLSFPSGGEKKWGDNYGVLSIRDRQSAEEIMEITLTAENIAGLLGSRAALGPAEIITQERFGRLGKKLEFAEIELDEVDLDYIKKLPYSTREPDSVMVMMAQGYKSEGKWDHVYWSRHNFGWRLNGRRWV